MISEEIILERDRVQVLVNELSRMLSNEDYFQFKIRFDPDRITVIPHANPVVVAR